MLLLHAMWYVRYHVQTSRTAESDRGGNSSGSDSDSDDSDAEHEDKATQGLFEVLNHGFNYEI